MVIGRSELHVFADASARAYGAIVYLLWPTMGGPYVQLVSAKAGVAPLQHTTMHSVGCIEAFNNHIWLHRGFQQP